MPDIIAGKPSAHKINRNKDNGQWASLLRPLLAANLWYGWTLTNTEKKNLRYTVHYTPNPSLRKTHSPRYGLEVRLFNSVIHFTHIQLQSHISGRATTPTSQFVHAFESYYRVVKNLTTSHKSALGLWDHIHQGRFQPNRKTLRRNLYTTLHKLIGRNCEIEVELSTFGIKVNRVWITQAVFKSSFT